LYQIKKCERYGYAVQEFQNTLKKFEAEKKPFNISQVLWAANKHKINLGLLILILGNLLQFLGPLLM